MDDTSALWIDSPTKEKLTQCRNNFRGLLWCQHRNQGFSIPRNFSSMCLAMLGFAYRYCCGWGRLELTVLAYARADLLNRATNLNFRYDHELRSRHEHVSNERTPIGCAVYSNAYRNAVYIMRNIRPSTLNQAQFNMVLRSAAAVGHGYL